MAGMTSGLGSDLPGEGVTGVTSQQLHDLFNDGKHWDHKQMWAFQSSQLAQLLRHARTHVPFYKERLDCLFREDGSIDWRRWLEVPIVTRKDLQQHRNSMLSPVIPAGHGRPETSRTSGSSGEPVAVDVTTLAKLVSSHAWDRAYRLHGFRTEKGTTEFQTFLPSGQPLESAYHVQPGDSIRTAKTILNRALSIPEKVALLRQTGAVLLADMPNHVEVLARENLRQHSPVKLEGVVGIGMATSPEQEALFARSFGARTFSPYSSTECGLMAFQCAVHRSNFHVNAELVLMEVLDSQGRPTVPGQAGRVIVTPFFNAAQPLIRYEHGDIAVQGESCSCGLRLPVMASILGRIDDMFYVAGKAVAFNSLNERLVQETLRADAIQIAQIASDHVVIRYVSQLEADEKVQTALVHNVRAVLSAPDIKVSFTRRAEIPFNAGGKQQRFKREFEIPSDADKQ
jgi:phenylacetate-CoA ligase